MAKAYAPKPAEVHAANIGTLKESIKSGNLSGVYVFYGDEEYTKNFYYDKLADACGNRGLNVKTFAGAEFKLEHFINACDTAPADTSDMFSMMEEDEEPKTTYRLVRLINPKLSVLSKKDESYFLSKLEDPDEGTIILFWFYADAEAELTKGIYKQITEAALTVNFKHETKGSPSLVAWILKHFNHEHIEIERNIAMYMSNYVGCDMTELKNEIDNCINYLKFTGRTKITAEDIEFICKKSSEAQIFDISTYTLNGNYAEAMSALKILVDTARKKDDEIAAVFGLIFKSVYDLCNVEINSRAGEGSALIAKKTGLHEFVVKKNLAVLSTRARSFAGKTSYTAYASEVCLHYDALIKSSRTPRYELLKELIFKLACGSN